MKKSSFITTKTGRRLAYHRIQGCKPWVVFLGGLRSDMTGTKAVHLDHWANMTGQAFVRFDYSGHGDSSGQFTDGCIGDWTDDAVAVLETLTDGPCILVGSSMGGWIALLIAKRRAGDVAGLVTIAAAPDFTEDLMWATWPPDRQRTLINTGHVALPSDYGQDLVITRRMIEDGRNHLVLRAPLSCDYPVRMVQGAADTDVPMAVSLRILSHVEGPDIRLELVKDADHRFSTPLCLAIITRTVEELLKGLG